MSLKCQILPDFNPPFCLLKPDTCGLSGEMGSSFDYPMTAAGPGALRTTVAKSMGLGEGAAPHVKLPSPPTTVAILEGAIPNREKPLRASD